MAFRQQVAFYGHVAGKPRTFPVKEGSGIGVSFRFAHNDGYTDRQSGQWTEQPTLFFGVTCFGTLAENVLNTLTSGDPVVVIGRMRPNDWVDQHGVQRHDMDISADAVGLDLRSGTAGRFVRNSQHSGRFADPVDVEERVTDESIAAVIEGEQADVPF